MLADTAVFSALPKLKRTRLGRQVAIILRRYIVQMGLTAGDKLPSERDLSRRLGVSHRVIRDALAELTDEGLIAKQHGRGAFVCPYASEALAARLNERAGEEDPIELAEARAALECGIMPLVARRISETDLARLEALLQRERERYAAGESPAEEDILFHTSLLQLAGNKMLDKLGSLIAASLRENIYRAPALLRESVTEGTFTMETHAEILAALRAGDPWRATQAMMRHLKLIEWACDQPDSTQKRERG